MGSLDGFDCVIHGETPDRSTDDLLVQFQNGADSTHVWHTFSVTHNGASTQYPVAVKTHEPLNGCSKNSASTDWAVFRLDERIPISSIRPMHLPLNGYHDCKEWTPDSFSGILIGYGDTEPSWQISGDVMSFRNFHDSAGWERESEHPVPPYVYPFDEDLDGAVYANYWPAVAFTAAYHGILHGDSGGPLVTAMQYPDMLPHDGFVGNPEGRLLCGVGSRFYPALPSDTWEWETGLAGADYAAIDGANLGWLAPYVIATDNNFIGECFAGVVPELQDLDADGDLIPDACDPCPKYYDANYDLSTTPDFDDDGVPDRCDNCPTVANPLEDRFDTIQGTWSRVQPDYDADGYGNACDKCPDTDKVVGAPGFFTDYTCCTTDDDCRPALGCHLVGGEGQPPPSGASQRCFPGDSRGADFAKDHPNVPLCANHCDMPIDSDCDEVPNHCDDCPARFDPGQSDTDGDGIGDACDNCPGSSTEPSQPADWNPPCDYFGSGDADCKKLNPESRCIPAYAINPAPANVARCTKDRDGDSDGVGDNCDSCADVYNPLPQLNCNVDIEKAGGKAYPYVGDVCDPNPCTSVSVFGYPSPMSITEGTLQKILYSPFLLPGGRPTSPVYPYSSFHTTKKIPYAKVGMRFCNCHNGGQPNAQDCQALGCPLNSAEYTMSTKWNAVSLDQTLQTHTGVPFQADAEYSKLRVIDPIPGDPTPSGYLPYGSAPVLSTLWYVGHDASVFGTDQNYLRGVLWSHVPLVTALLPSEATAATQFHPWSNHYEAGTYGQPPSSLPLLQARLYIPIPRLDVIGPQIDPRRFADVPNLVVDDTGTVVQLRAADDAVDLTPFMSQTALAALSDPTSRWIPAAETQDWPGAGLAQMVSIDAAGTSVKSAISMSGEQVVDLLALHEIPIGDGDVPRSATASAMSAQEFGGLARSQFGAVFSSRANALFILGGVSEADQSQLKDVVQFSLANRGWTQFAVTGAGRPGIVLAATYRPQDQALYAIDEIRIGAARFARLIRIDTGDFSSAVLGLWPRRPSRDRVFLTNTELGNLLIVGAGLHTYAAVELELRMNGYPRTVAGFLGTGRVAANPYLTSHGLTVPLEDASQGVRNRFVPADELDKRVTFLPGECF